jgi:hypothetical protein
MASIRQFPDWLWSVGLCALFLLGCGAVYLGVTNDWGSGPTESELISEGWPYCADWAGSMGIAEDAECIDDGKLVRYYDTSYGADLKRVHDYVENID